MRGGNQGTNNSTRFSMDYEAKSMYEGIAEDLGGVVGQEVDWFRWQEYWFDENYSNVVDDVYDTSSSTAGKGRRWMLPFKLPTVMAQLLRSSNVMNERGFYVTDTLRLVINVGDVQRLIPEMITDPTSHIRDRILYRGQVYVPTRVLPRGSFGNRWAVVTIDCNQVNPEELVNDPQFQNYAQPVTPEIRTTNVFLKSLSFSPQVVLTPAFNKDVFSYTGTVELLAGVTSVTVTPLAVDGTNTIVRVNGGANVISGMSTTVALPTNTTTISTVVTTPYSSATKTYTVVVTKA